MKGAKRPLFLCLYIENCLLQIYFHQQRILGRGNRLFLHATGAHIWAKTTLVIQYPRHQKTCENSTEFKDLLPRQNYNSTWEEVFQLLCYPNYTYSTSGWDSFSKRFQDSHGLSSSHWAILFLTNLLGRKPSFGKLDPIIDGLFVPLKSIPGLMV